MRVFCPFAPILERTRSAWLLQSSSKSRQVAVSYLPPPPSVSITCSSPHPHCVCAQETIGDRNQTFAPCARCVCRAESEFGTEQCNKSKSFFVLPFQFSALTTGTRRCYTVIVNLSSSDYIRLYLILDGVYSRGYGSSATMVVIYPPY